MATRFSWKRFIKRGAAIAALAEVGYVFAAYVFLNHGPLKKLINAKPDELNLTYDWAYSIVPGRVNVRHLGFRVTDDAMQMYFEIDRVTVGVDLLRLSRRVFHTHFVDTGKVKFFLRFNREAESLAPRELVALPPIPGFEKPVKPPPKPPSGPFDPWKVWLEGIDLAWLEELWIEEFHFRGKIAVKGGFFLHPQTAVRIEPSSLKFQHGLLEIGNELTLLNTKGDARFSMRQFDAKGVPGNKVFTHLSGQLNFSSEVENLDFINHYLKRVSWLRLGKGAGHLDLALKVEEGKVKQGSHLHSVTENLRAQLGRQNLQGRGELEWTVDEAKKLSELQLQLKKFRVAHNQNDRHFIVGENLRIGAVAHNLDLSDALKKVALSIDLPEAEITHLGYFNAFIPPESKVKFMGGTGRVDAFFRSYPDGARDHGTFALKTEAAQVRYRNHDVTGELDVTARIDRSRFSEADIRIADANVQVSRFVTRDKARPWAANVSLVDSRLDFKHRPKVDLHVDIRGDNARPIYAFLNEESRGSVPFWLPGLVPFTQLRFQSHIRFGDGKFSAAPVLLTANNSSLTGRMRQDSQGTWGLFLFEAGPIAAALEMEKDHTRLRLQNATDWFRKRERETARNDFTP